MDEEEIIVPEPYTLQKRLRDYESLSGLLSDFLIHRVVYKISYLTLSLGIILLFSLEFLTYQGSNFLFNISFLLISTGGIILGIQEVLSEEPEGNIHGENFLQAGRRLLYSGGLTLIFYLYTHLLFLSGVLPMIEPLERLYGVIELLKVDLISLTLFVLGFIPLTFFFSTNISDGILQLFYVVSKSKVIESTKKDPVEISEIIDHIWKQE